MSQFLKNIKVRDFRNLIKVDCEFVPGYNLLIGANGQGKTNLLEAIYYLSILRSFRTSSIRELKSWKSETDVFFISSEISEENSSRKLSVAYGKKRSVKINGIELSKASDYIGELISIVFSPEDIELITGTGKIRRRFMDIALSQLSKSYLQSLQAYSHALKNRNKLLKNKQGSFRKVIASFDKELIKHGTVIHLERIKFFESIKAILEHKSTNFYGAEKKFSMDYNSKTSSIDSKNYEAVEKEFTENLAKNLEKDIERGVTHCGPHRDDFSVNLQGKRLQSFGSRGQCRLASLLLRLCSSELFLLEEHKNDIIFLVDDVTGELDDNVKNEFFKLLEKGSQVFFAATEIPEVLKNRQDMKIFSVKDGEIDEAITL